MVQTATSFNGSSTASISKLVKTGMYYPRMTLQQNSMNDSHVTVSNSHVIEHEQCL